MCPVTQEIHVKGVGAVIGDRDILVKGPTVYRVPLTTVPKSGNIGSF